MSLSTVDDDEEEDLPLAERLWLWIFPGLTRQWRAQFGKRVLEAIKLPEVLIISYKNPLRDLWDLWIIFLAFVNCLVVPLEISISPAWTQTRAF